MKPNIFTHRIEKKWTLAAFLLFMRDEEASAWVFKNRIAFIKWRRIYDFDLHGVSMLMLLILLFVHRHYSRLLTVIENLPNYSFVLFIESKENESFLLGASGRQKNAGWKRPRSVRLYVLVLLGTIYPTILTIFLYKK